MNHSNTHSKLLDIIGLSKESSIILGRLLSELKRDDSFKEAIGEGIDTWRDYLAQPEIGLSVGEANRMVQIYDEFVSRLGFNEAYLAEIPVKNLHYLLPIVKKMDLSDDVDELLESARTLSQKDFKERIYDLKDDSGERTYEYLVMKRCIETGNMTKVHDITSEEIKEKLNVG